MAKSDVETRRAVASVTAIMSVEDNFVNIDDNRQSFGNRTFDCVRLAKFYCEFDYVRLSSVIERLVFDWVRLPNCSIG